MKKKWIVMVGVLCVFVMGQGSSCVDEIPIGGGDTYDSDGGDIYAQKDTENSEQNSNVNDARVMEGNGWRGEGCICVYCLDDCNPECDHEECNVEED